MSIGKKFQRLLAELDEAIHAEQNIKYKQIAETVSDKLREQFNLVNNNGLSLVTFQKKASEIIKEALPLLEESPTWTNFFSNMLRGIANMFLSKTNQYSYFRPKPYNVMRNFVDNQHIRIVTTGFATDDMNFDAVQKAMTDILKPLMEAGYSQFEFIHYDTLTCPLNNNPNKQTIRKQHIKQVMETIIPTVMQELGIAKEQVTQRFEPRYLHANEVKGHRQQAKHLLVLDGAHIFTNGQKKDGSLYVSMSVSEAEGEEERDEFPSLQVVYHPIYQSAGNSSTDPLPPFLLMASPLEADGFITCTTYAYKNGIEFDPHYPTQIPSPQTTDIRFHPN